jgi:hypothetical protein
VDGRRCATQEAGKDRTSALRLRQLGSSAGEQRPLLGRFFFAGRDRRGRRSGGGGQRRGRHKVQEKRIEEERSDVELTVSKRVCVVVRVLCRESALAGAAGAAGGSARFGAVRREYRILAAAARGRQRKTKKKGEGERHTQGNKAERGENNERRCVRRSFLHLSLWGSFIQRDQDEPPSRENQRIAE